MKYYLKEGSILLGLKGLQTVPYGRRQVGTDWYINLNLHHRPQQF
jgi:hypothetical protein